MKTKRNAKRTYGIRGEPVRTSSAANLRVGWPSFQRDLKIFSKPLSYGQVRIDTSRNLLPSMALSRKYDEVHWNMTRLQCRHNLLRFLERHIRIMVPVHYKHRRFYVVDFMDR